MKKEGRTARYVGSLVADFHRNLLKGGIFMYPANRKKPSGHIRLMFESNPMAFIIGQAGGRGSDGKGNILDLKPKGIHQRTPIFLGSKSDIRLIEKLMKGENNE